MYDAIVVGSGHNALVSACYLADAGWSVTVLERDTVPGGAVSTVERFPGHRIDRGSSAHLMVRHTGIVEELGLDRHGLSYLECDPWAFAPAPPGDPRPGIVFHTDLDATCDSIAAACGSKDAAAYRRFVADWTPLSRRVMAAFGGPPTGTSLARAFGGLGVPRLLGGQGNDAAAIARVFLGTGDGLLDEYFDDERLKAALAWFGAQSGPPMSEPGTAPMVGFAALMHTLPPGRARGGSGALAEAMVAKLQAGGHQVFLGEGVTAIGRRGDDWAVRTAAGRTLTARTVVSGAHVLTTLDLLAAGDALPAEQVAAYRRRIRLGPGIGMAVRLAGTALPEYPSAPAVDGAGVHAGLQLLVTDRGQLRTAHGAALAGQAPPEPAVLAMTFSALDPTLSPEGTEQATLWSQWHPYRRADGTDWAAVVEAEADRVLAQVDRYAPGFSDTITDRYLQSPPELERELGLLGGNIMHVEMSLDQMLPFRPLPELADHRIPGLTGMYLTGASTHPGGGVSGASGRTAAQAMLADARGGVLRRLRGAGWAPRREGR